jgi:hypothetical protein
MQPSVRIEKIADGLGFGRGDISRAAIEAETGETAQVIDEAIRSQEVLVPVDIDETTGAMIEDDGCGDGRPVRTIHRKVAGVVQSFARSLHRPKVFGGGVTMAAASLIGLGQVAGKRLQDIFEAGVDLMKEHRVDYGAHTADYVKRPTDSGCGAIDNAPAIVEAAVTYQENIRAVLGLLNVDTSGLDSVEANFAAVAAANRGHDYSGRKVMDDIVDDGKVVKELVGRHIETRIVLNFVEGHTVNQKFIRARTGGKADAFAVDVWRIRRLAEKLFPNDPTAQHQAVLSELVYTLATAGVLTKGDLPVYSIREG